MISKPAEIPEPKACTKTKNCAGTMTWNLQFRAMGAKGGAPYRPAWVCDKCLKHDYVKGTISAIPTGIIHVAELMDE